MNATHTSLPVTVPFHAERPCPHCGRLGFADATRCGYCWMKLEPLEPLVPLETAGRRRPNRPKEHTTPGALRDAVTNFESEGGPAYR
jgi:hypothetical protein